MSGVELTRVSDTLKWDPQGVRIRCPKFYRSMRRLSSTLGTKDGWDLLVPPSFPASVMRSCRSVSSAIVRGVIASQWAGVACLPERSEGLTDNGG